MTGERYSRVRLILQAAWELEPNARAALLDKSCAGDPELRAEVESLLQHDRESAQFLERPAPETMQVALRLKRGSRLGSYEIIEHIGAGAMGDVYRAHDSRLARDVALKLLPKAFARDPDRLFRFEREARAAGSLNHPNILTVYEFGSENGTPYLVSELLRGETLRQRLDGSAIPCRTALVWAAGMARGLSAGHAAGIVHRDLKPANIFIVKGGAVKILDFGLAQLRPAAPCRKDAPLGIPTQPGMVLGSMGYASPEQVRGEPTDHRSDIFSLGVILHEMLTGRRPFAGGTWVEEANNVVHQEPPELPADLPGVSTPALLRRILRRCLTKQPDERIDSAHALAVLFESLAEPAEPERVRRGLYRIIGIAAAAVMVAAGVFIARSWFPAAPPRKFDRLTFRRGTVSAARFSADGNTIVYSAAWDRNDFGLFSTRLDRKESRALGQPNAMLFALSSRGDLALCLPTRRTQHGVVGSLARVPLAGGGPLVRAENVSAADWSPDGMKLAIVRVESDRPQIEYPIGHVLYRSKSPSTYVDAIRVSRRGDAVAFLEHPLQDDSAGQVAVVDINGNYRPLSSRFNSMRGLAWSADGSEIWFAAAKRGLSLDVWAVTRSGRERVVERFPAYISVEDISRDRRALISLHTLSQSMVHVTAVGDLKDLYWHDQSQVRDISRDNRSILFAESGDATGQDYEAYIRSADGSSPAVYLGVGLPQSLSPDGRWAVANPAGNAAPLTLLPTGPGEPRTFGADQISRVGAAWLSDGKSIVFAGMLPGGDVRYYIQAADGGPARAITGNVHYERRSPIVASPDGGAVAAVNVANRIAIYPIASGPTRLIPSLDAGFTPLQWCPDGDLVVHRYDEPSPQLWKVDTKTGRLVPWKQITPPDSVGLLDLTPVRVSPDCQSYAYSPLNVLSSVYLTIGLR